MAGTASREYVKAQIDYLPEAQLDGILRAINAAKLKLVSDGVAPAGMSENDNPEDFNAEAEDMAYCTGLYDAYVACEDDDEPMVLADFAESLGIDLGASS
ncbi:MAG: hypothetical protein FWG90_09185 [Oscillospiraceae bacterium]|nr:hypothetical protein [Oscillospiraceae bacterium]